MEYISEKMLNHLLKRLLFNSLNSQLFSNFNLKIKEQDYVQWARVKEVTRYKIFLIPKKLLKAK